LDEHLGKKVGGAENIMLTRSLKSSKQQKTCPIKCSIVKEEWWCGDVR
jgi:hypothetical protein